MGLMNVEQQFDRWMEANHPCFYPVTGIITGFSITVLAFSIYLVFFAGKDAMPVMLAALLLFVLNKIIGGRIIRAYVDEFIEKEIK